jgi:hypothetical protein
MPDIEALENEIKALKEALRFVTKMAGESALTVLSMSIHMNALKAVLSLLDSRAEQLWEQALAVEQDKRQREIETLQMMLAAMQAKGSRKVQ